MIGFVAGDPHPSEGFSWIATIGVAPEYRRRGIGRELLRACEAKSTTPRIRLSVRASNDGAIRLYEQEGYQRIEVWQNYYNDGEAAIVMEKQRGYNRNDGFRHPGFARIGGIPGIVCSLDPGSRTASTHRGRYRIE